MNNPLIPQDLGDRQSLPTSSQPVFQSSDFQTDGAQFSSLRTGASGSTAADSLPNLFIENTRTEPVQMAFAEQGGVLGRVRSGIKKGVEETKEGVKDAGGLIKDGAGKLGGELREVALKVSKQPYKENSLRASVDDFMTAQRGGFDVNASLAAKQRIDRMSQPEREKLWNELNMWKLEATAKNFGTQAAIGAFTGGATVFLAGAFVDKASDKIPIPLPQSVKALKESVDSTNPPRPQGALDLRSELTTFTSKHLGLMGTDVVGNVDKVIAGMTTADKAKLLADVAAHNKATQLKDNVIPNLPGVGNREAVPLPKSVEDFRTKVDSTVLGGTPSMDFKSSLHLVLARQLKMSDPREINAMQQVLSNMSESNQKELFGDLAKHMAMSQGTHIGVDAAVRLLPGGKFVSERVSNEVNNRLPLPARVEQFKHSVQQVYQAGKR